MKVILIKDVPKIGKRFDVKEVSDGHAINLLIPRGLAIAATPDAVKRIQSEKGTIEAEKKVHEELLSQNLKNLGNVILTITGKANDKGHLFAGLHADAIAAELQKQTRLQIDPSFIVMDGPLKSIGEHIVEVKAAGKSAKFKVIVQKA